MGATNVQTVYARWGHLPDRAFRLLAYMALVTMDSDTLPKFWQGRESMAVALGRMTPEEPADSDVSERAESFRKARSADFQAVKIALQVLTRCGVVVVDKSARRGRNATYLLHLTASMGKDQPTELGRINLPMGKDQPTNGVGPAYPQGVLGVLGEVEEPNHLASQPSPELSTGRAAEKLMSFTQASRLLREHTTDHGESWLAQVPDAVTSMKDRVIVAATLMATERGISWLVVRGAS
jgi:hypothetical protein